MSTQQSIYRIMFTQKDEVYELYSRAVGEDELLGFIQVDEIVWSKDSSLVTAAEEEKIKSIFANVQTTLIPMHAILRIDVVTPEEPLKSIDDGNNVHHLPSSAKGKSE